MITVIDRVTPLVSPSGSSVRLTPLTTTRARKLTAGGYTDACLYNRPVPLGPGTPADVEVLRRGLLYSGGQFFRFTVGA